jgi:NADH:ubiquinone oxidoreductase subunit H
MLAAVVCTYGLTWVIMSSLLAVLFVLIIFVRITVPRFRLETLSRLGWSTLISFLGVVWLLYLAGFTLA